MPKSKKSKKVKSSASNGMSARGVFHLAHNEKNAGVRPFTYATLVLPIAFTSSSMTGGAWYWQFRGNSLYDPDFTGVGSQPTTFDQWMALYDRYRVLGVEVDFVLRDLTNASCGLAAAIAPGVDSAPTLTYTGVAGMRGACLGKIVPATSGIVSLKKTFLMKDIFGIDEEAMMSELNYSGTSSTSAPSVAYLTLGAYGSSVTGAVMLTGIMRFAVRFESPHSNNVSLASHAASGTIPAPLPRPGEGSSDDRLWNVDTRSIEVELLRRRQQTTTASAPQKLFYPNVQQ